MRSIDTENSPGEDSNIKLRVGPGSEAKHPTFAWSCCRRRLRRCRSHKDMCNSEYTGTQPDASAGLGAFDAEPNDGSLRLSRPNLCARRPADLPACLVWRLLVEPGRQRWRAEELRRAVVRIHFLARRSTGVGRVRLAQGRRSCIPRASQRFFRV